MRDLARILMSRDNHQNLQKESRSCQILQEKEIIDQNLQEKDNHQNLQDEKKTNEKNISWIDLIRLVILTRDQTGWAGESSVLFVEANIAR